MNKPPRKTPLVVADGPLAETILAMLEGKTTLLPWETTEQEHPEVEAIYTYGHPSVDGEMLDRFPALKVVSNYGVGVDHINLADAAERNIPVGNTPGILDGATADMAMTLLLATGRRLIEGDRYARSGEFTHYDPGYILGREVHGATIGIVGLGRVGVQIARRALGFGMQVLYHNRRRREAEEAKLGVSYADFDQLLAQSDYVVLSTPLTEATRGLIGAEELKKMKSTAILINIARGGVVDTDALTEALQSREIHAAGVDVTDPEPLPRDHPLLKLDNLVIAPHLGSATVETRRKMAELSVANLLAGLQGSRLPNQVSAAG